MGSVPGRQSGSADMAQCPCRSTGWGDCQQTFTYTSAPITVLLPTQTFVPRPIYYEYLLPRPLERRFPVRVDEQP